MNYRLFMNEIGDMSEYLDFYEYASIRWFLEMTYDWVTITLILESCAAD